MPNAFMHSNTVQCATLFSFDKNGRAARCCKRYDWQWCIHNSAHDTKLFRGRLLFRMRKHVIHIICGKSLSARGVDQGAHLCMPHHVKWLALGRNCCSPHSCHSNRSLFLNGSLACLLQSLLRSLELAKCSVIFELSLW